MTRNNDRLLERLRYFFGQRLGPEDFQAEQNYQLDRFRRRALCLHGWGVVCGCMVASIAGARRVTISPGCAVSPQGDEIVVDEQTDFNLVGATGTYLAVRYIERGTRPVASRAGDPEFSRIKESFELRLLADIPASHRETRATEAAWAVAARAALLAGAGVPPPPCLGRYDDPWVVLAQIQGGDIGLADRRVLLGVGALQVLTVPPL
jgi:hypothetical protein